MDTAIFDAALNLFKEKLASFKDKYNPSALFDKIKETAKKAGVKLIYYVLILYYSLIGDKVLLKEKVLVIAALGYFISPVDFIPDFLVPGLIDDMAILGYVLKRIYSSIDEDVMRKAKAKLDEWFPVDEINSIDPAILSLEDLSQLSETTPESISPHLQKRIDEAREAYKNGTCISCKTPKELTDFLDSL